MKKLLILTSLLGLAACDRSEVFELKCVSGDIYKPYKDVVLQVEEGRLLITDKAGKEQEISFVLDESTRYSDKNSGTSVSLENGYIEFVSFAKGHCDVVVPMGTHFDADCTGIKLSGQINKDYALVSIDGGKDMRLPLSKKYTDETDKLDTYLFKEAENGWSVFVVADTGVDKVFQISISEPNGMSTYNGCNVMIPLKD